MQEEKHGLLGEIYTRSVHNLLMSKEASKEIDAVAVGSRIRQLRKARGWTQKQLSERAAPISASRIGNYEQGTRALDVPTAIRLAEAFGEGVSAAYILGIQKIYHITPPLSTLEVQELGGEYDCYTHTRVPIIGYAKMGDDGYYDEMGYPPGFGDGYVFCLTKDADAYALKVRGNSMSPAIEDGWIVVVSPAGEPQPLEYVAVATSDGRKMVKKFVARRDGEILLQSVNREHGEIRLDQRDIDNIHPVVAVYPPSMVKDVLR